MAEKTTQPAAAGDAEQSQEAAKRQFSLTRIYLKDLSFETPQGAAAFSKQWKPKVNQDMSTKTNKLDDEHYEVVLAVTVTVKDDESTIYLAEVQQAGIFRVMGLEGIHLAQVLNTACPNMLFPYVRETLDNIVIKGSFPPLMLPPINFDAVFQQVVAKAQQEARDKAAEQGFEQEESPVTH